VLLTAHADRPFEGAQRQFLMQLLASRRATLQTQDAAGNAGAQAAQFDQAAAAKAAVIVVDPVDVGLLKDRVQKATSAGTLVIGLGREAQAAPFSTVLYCDQVAVGREAGRIAARALAMKAQEEGRSEVAGRVVAIRGADDSATSTQRHEGFMEALKETPGVVLVHDAPGGWTRVGGKQRMEEAVRVQRSFDVVYAHNDMMALGAADAAGELRANLMIIGSDGYQGPEGGYTLVENGDLDATVYQPLLVDFAWHIIRKWLVKPDLALKPSYELKPLPITPKEIERIRREGMPKFPEL
jgi:ABC-type sugar transport system substrate-binding protein